MKKLIQWIGCTALLLAAMGADAQVDNINNQNGPPVYTGGTVPSTNETFALYNQQRANERVVVRNSVGIMEMYPNPATDHTRVVLTDLSTEFLTVSVINMNGMIVQSYEYGTGSGQFDLDVSALPTGIYAIQVQERGKEAQSIQLSKY